MSINYYLPVELQNIINEYAKPLTRPDWRKGSYMMWSYCKNDLIGASVFRSYIEYCSNDLKNIKSYSFIINQEI